MLCFNILKGIKWYGLILGKIEVFVIYNFIMLMDRDVWEIMVVFIYSILEMKNEEVIKGMKKGFRYVLGVKFVVFKVWNCLFVYCEWLFKFENFRN